LQKALDKAKKMIADLTAELKAVKAELLEYKSVLGKLDRAGLERENAELREKVRWYDSIIDAKNLRNLQTPMESVCCWFTTQGNNRRKTGLT